MGFKIVIQQFRDEVSHDTLRRLAEIDLALEKIAIVVIQFLVYLALDRNVDHRLFVIFQKIEAHVHQIPIIDTEKLK